MRYSITARMDKTENKKIATEKQWLFLFNQVRSYSYRITFVTFLPWRLMNTPLEGFVTFTPCKL